MGKIKIVSDGTLAGTVVMTVRQPVLSLEHCEGGLTYV